MERLSNARPGFLVLGQVRAGWDMLTADVSLPATRSAQLPGTACRIEGSIRRQIMKRMMILDWLRLALVASVLAGSTTTTSAAHLGTTWRTLLEPAMPMRRDNRSSTTAWARAASTPRCRFHSATLARRIPSSYETPRESRGKFAKTPRATRERSCATLRTARSFGLGARSGA